MCSKALPGLTASISYEINPFSSRHAAVNLTGLKENSESKGHLCPPEYIALLETKRYSLNTARTCITLFSAFRSYFINKALHEINEVDIRHYLQEIVKESSHLRTRIRQSML